MSLRKTIFWIHLASGLVAGAVIAIMSATGIAIAFEEEILAWFDRDVSLVEPPTAGAPLPIEDLIARVERERPEFDVTAIRIHNDPARAYELYAGREGHLYVDPYSGSSLDSRARAAHDFMHLMEEWHRWLGMEGAALPTGRLITGVCNVAFLVLCVTGIYLWCPRKWSWRALRPSLWFLRKYKGKARDYNWHVVLGIWSAPFLAVLAATAVVISFAWAHALVFNLAGEEAPKSRNYGMMAVPPAAVPEPPPGSRRLPYDAVLARVAEAFPEREWIALDLPAERAEGEPAQPLEIGVNVPDFMPSRAYIPVEADPFTGEILQATRFQDRGPGLRARVWIRFLHTGAALGLPGKIVATLATAASLVLVYTGFALSWRRFFGKRGRAPSS